jgi:hypothetical protein
MAPSLAVSVAVWVRAAAPARVKVYAEPWPALAPMSSRDAPATIVSPSTATETPSSSPTAPSLAVSLAV